VDIKWNFIKSVDFFPLMKVLRCDVSTSGAVSRVSLGGSTFILSFPQLEVGKGKRIALYLHSAHRHLKLPPNDGKLAASPLNDS